MSTMTSRSQQTRRLLAGVETAFGSGAFRIDDRLRVEEVVQKSDQAISSAIISVRIDDDFDSAEARHRYHPDLRIIVTSDEVDPADREILFEGYPPLHTSRWDGRISREEEAYVFQAEHVLDRLSREKESMVYGRYMRTGAIEDGLAVDPDAFADRSELITALPCVFNPDGEGNRAPVALAVTHDGQSRSIPIFTWANILSAKWTYADALRYLVWFHLLHEGPVLEGNSFEVTESTDGDDALSQALRREPVSLTCEATSLIEALSLLCESAGIRFTADTSNSDGRPVTELRFWSPEDGSVKQLYLARGGRYEDGTLRYDATDRSVSRVLSENNTYRGRVTWNDRSVINAPIVIGDIKRYEMTLPLKPGWLPRDWLDNVDVGDRQTAKDKALTPAQVETLGDDTEGSEWYRRYHRQGSLFKYDSDVSRLWVLNEDGRRHPDFYDRNAPFDDYSPFDFSTVADSNVTTAGAWIRRPRRLLPTISTTTDGRRLGVWVEISFDSGTTWQQQAGGVRVLDDQIGIYFEAENPTEIAPTGVDPATQNMWYALIDQTFRVRVTAVIESDDRLMGHWPADATDASTLQLNAMVVRQPKSFQFVSRLNTDNVLRDVTSVSPLERDDTASIESTVRRLALVNQERDVRVAPAIPWLETGYAIGDRISEIRGRHLRFATTAGVEPRYPAVLERRFALMDGRYETVLTLGVTPMPGWAV